MQILRHIFLLCLVSFFVIGCPKDEDDTPEPTEQGDNASGSVTSTTSGTIETEAGARLVVPVGAVPVTEGGTPGTMVFSIERNNDLAVTVPGGETRVSDIYQFGPEGFTFARPVEVAVPVPGDDDPGDVSLWRRNPTTGEPEFFASAFDAETRTVRAQTYQLSPWFITSRPVQDDASGCLHVTNTALSWLNLCVDTYELEYPAQTDWIPEAGQGVLYAPSGTIGWSHTGNWYLPQGTYTFCLQRESSVTPGTYYHVISDPVTIGSAWHYNDPRCVEFSVGDFASPLPDRCPCIPTPSTSVGTGDIQVTLTWYNAQDLDLDLWVTDPTGEICYYGNNPSTTGGVLDRDNLCGNYENGRPENIYWTNTPPTGEYKVEVDWFSDCGNGIPSQSVNVRTVVGGTSQSYQRTINSEETIEVVRFNFTGTTVNFLPPRMGPVVGLAERKPKL